MPIQVQNQCLYTHDPYPIFSPAIAMLRFALTHIVETPIDIKFSMIHAVAVSRSIILRLKRNSEETGKKQLKI